MKIDADEKELLDPSNGASGSPRRRQARTNALLALRQGHVPQGPAAEHPAV